MEPLRDKRIVITGGTGSLGKVLVRRILTGEMGRPRKIVVFSRDEAKQHLMRLEWEHRRAATDEIIYHNFERTLEFRIGDVRDYAAIASALRGADIVVNAAAMKQVPTCEYFPFEAVRTNVEGAEHIVRAIQQHDLPVETVIGISTDKACKPVNTMGMTKALQERILIQGNMRRPSTRFVCVRYGNVLASRGSVIPLFHEQIRSGGPVTVTTPDMTRFLLSLDDAVDTVFAALKGAKAGEIYVPRAPAALVMNVAKAMVGSRQIEIRLTGIRPGEKIHEIMVSEEEIHHTEERGKWFAIRSMLPELSPRSSAPPALSAEYSSGTDVMSFAETQDLLRRHELLTEPVPASQELLR
jgi:FlaA1/EpsC-like NDP-sugar epimerase